MIRLWDVETSKSLHVFNGHEYAVCCVDISPLQSNNKNDNNNNKMNNIGVIGGNGYTICSGSWDNTIRIWDIETAKQLNVLKGHEDWISSVKYGSNELLNTILSGSDDQSVRLWDIRSSKQIQVFNGHTNTVWSVEYSPFVIKNSIGNSNVICSGSYDNTIRFWDIRSNKNELHMIKGYDKEDDGILCLKFIVLKKKEKTMHVPFVFGVIDFFVEQEMKVFLFEKFDVFFIALNTIVFVIIHLHKFFLFQIGISFRIYKKGKGVLNLKGRQQSKNSCFDQ
ncbi:WD-40 repeat protein [Reticulomyxa filosa]|uniref:WD-40 repeat protein n=1 Tax=Reticulomyxa filosa TaxID=46433 RepID=X6N191_RETFI|nr:WD-40 repeat protein [Reticulomyxa filosa]|eukprot:ETO19097.1 WD-40 repeat protein [Reticulomyxa filosa]